MRADPRAAHARRTAYRGLLAWGLRQQRLDGLMSSESGPGQPQLAAAVRRGRVCVPTKHDLVSEITGLQCAPVSAIAPRAAEQMAIGVRPARVRLRLIIRATALSRSRRGCSRLTDPARRTRTVDGMRRFEPRPHGAGGRRGSIRCRGAASGRRRRRGVCQRRSMSSRSRERQSVVSTSGLCACTTACVGLRRGDGDDDPVDVCAQVSHESDEQDRRGGCPAVERDGDGRRHEDGSEEPEASAHQTQERKK